MLITVKTAVWGKNEIFSKTLLRWAAGAAQNIFADTRYFYSMLGNDPYLGCKKCLNVYLVQTKSQVLLLPWCQGGENKTIVEMTPLDNSHQHD